MLFGVFPADAVVRSGGTECVFRFFGRYLNYSGDVVD